jgi:hypothetical protein
VKLTLTAAEIRAGQFPPPINPQMNPRMWRWSRTRIERYIETGET